MVLTGSFVLSPVTGLGCHRHRRSLLRRLERQRRGVRTTRLRRPQVGALVSSTTCVHRIPPYVRDDRETPLCRDGMARIMNLIWVSGEAENFLRWDWTGRIALNRLNKSRFKNFGPWSKVPANDGATQARTSRLMNWPRSLLPTSHPSLTIHRPRTIVSSGQPVISSPS